RLSPGRAYLIPLNRRFDYGCDRHIEKFYIHFRLEYPPTFDLFDGTDEVIDLGKMPPGFAEKIFKLAENPSPLQLASLESHLLSVLSGANDQVGQKKSLGEWRLYERYQKILEHMDLHLDAHLRITELARLQNQPLSVFSRNFHKDFGMNVKTFVDERLARRAKELLLTTDKKVREVASDLGFRDE
ncbi:MAG: helix-turn-helix transcriptional regulator, partial [Spirochaetia bacterium]|nr:helix-turn-helix transcriptional regulator [Spirochaetia bacterium]